MKTKKLNLKALVLSLGLAAMMLPANVMAQEDAERPGGLFGLGDLFKSDGMFRDAGAQLEEDEEGFTNQTFDTPLGGGVAILLAAGLGYVALKKKEDEQ